MNIKDKLRYIPGFGGKLLNSKVTQRVVIASYSEANIDRYEKPELPLEVARYVELKRDEGWWLSAILGKLDEEMPEKVKKWLGFTPEIDMGTRRLHQNLFALAFLSGEFITYVEDERKTEQPLFYLKSRKGSEDPISDFYRKKSKLGKEIIIHTWRRKGVFPVHDEDAKFSASDMALIPDLKDYECILVEQVN